MTMRSWREVSMRYHRLTRRANSLLCPLYLSWSLAYTPGRSALPAERSDNNMCTLSFTDHTKAYGAGGKEKCQTRQHFTCFQGDHRKGQGCGALAPAPSDIQCHAAIVTGEQVVDGAFRDTKLCAAVLCNNNTRAHEDSGRRRNKR